MIKRYVSVIMIIIIISLGLSIPASSNELWWFPIVSYSYIGDKFHCGCSYHNGKHNGIDIPAAKGSAVRATKSGTVVASYSDCKGSHYKDYNSSGVYIGCSNGSSCGGKSMGNYVKIKHYDGTYSIYMHLSSVSVSNNSTVYQGQTIGGVGTTGDSTGNHLHFGIMNTSGIYVDPLEYVDPQNPNPSAEAPSNPTNLKSNKTVYNSTESITLSWDAVSGATHYWIYMWKDGVQLYGTDMGNTTSFTSAPTSPGNYTFIVRAGNSIGYSDGISYKFTVTDVPVTNAWLTVDKYNVAINNDVVFTYHADNAEYYELWLFRNGVCLGNTPLPLTGSYTTKFDTAGYYQAYISSSNSSGYIDSGKIEFNIYDNVPPDPWIYAEKNTLEVGEEVQFVYNASYVTHFSLGIDRYNERIISAYREWNETTYTASFNTPGTYTVYISAYNDCGYKDSKKVTFTVHDRTIENIGSDFYGKILNKACWKPTKNDNSILKLCNEKGYANELWRFIRQVDGSYEISSCTTGEYLITEKDENNVLSRVLIGSTVDTNKKQWFIYNYGNGVILKPKNSEYILTLADGKTTEGTEILLSPFNGDSSQIFNVYQGYDIQLTEPTLKIENINYNNIKLTWSEVSSASNYQINIYEINDLNNPLYIDDVKYGINSYELNLPTGNYIATVTAYNYFKGFQSNTVEFSLVTASTTNVVKKDNILTFTSILNITDAENATVLLGVYDKNDIMINLKKEMYENVLTFNIPYQDDIEYARLFVWDSLSGLKSLCNAEDIPSSEWIIE